MLLKTICKRVMLSSNQEGCRPICTASVMAFDVRCYIIKCSIVIHQAAWWIQEEYVA